MYLVFVWTPFDPEFIVSYGFTEVSIIFGVPSDPAWGLASLDLRVRRNITETNWMFSMSGHKETLLDILRTLRKACNLEFDDPRECHRCSESGHEKEPNQMLDNSI